jgi:hypothetical protein
MRGRRARFAVPSATVLRGALVLATMSRARRRSVAVDDADAKAQGAVFTEKTASERRV